MQQYTKADPADNGINGELRVAILEMDKAASCLRYELPGSVWDDVFKRWNNVRTLILAAHFEDYPRG